MQLITAIHTPEHQPFIGSIFRAGMPTLGASLTGVVSIYLDAQRTKQRGFIAQKAVKFPVCPGGTFAVGFASLLARVRPAGLLSTVSHSVKLLESDKRVGKGFEDSSGQTMVHIGLEPSFPSRHRDKFARGGTGAFGLERLTCYGKLTGNGVDEAPRLEQAAVTAKRELQQAFAANQGDKLFRE